MPELHETAATLGHWTSRGRRWEAKLVRNYAGAFSVLEYKHGRPCGCASRPVGFFSGDAAALEWARDFVRRCFDVQMRESAQ